MSSSPTTQAIDLSLEVLRRDHPEKYRRWVLVGVVASFCGYAVSSAAFVVQRSWADALGSGDPYVVLADVLALALLFGGSPRAAACVALAAVFVDVHFSLFVQRMPLLANVGLVVPAFVLTAGLLFGGRIALAAAAVIALGVPAVLWAAALYRPGAGLGDPATVRFLIVLEVVLLATTALVLALLRTSAEILEQHRQGEARRRALEAQLQHRQKLEALGQLAGGVAHDFNNLLAAVGGYASVLERSHDPRARAIGAEILAAQQRGAKLTKQLLAFARKDTAQPRPLDLARTLAGMTALLTRAMGERVQLHLEAEPGCAILADPGRIEQVVLNLAMNARDAMPHGGRLWIRCAARGGGVQLEVEDEGVGIDEAIRPRIFEPFFTTKGRNQGTGLGLSTVHGIVTESGGSIELASWIGRGTRFTVHWPRAALVPEPELEPALAIDGAGRTVLLVEDNEGARVHVERLLAEHGFRVAATGSAEEALALLTDVPAPPDLLLSDVSLPGLDGPQLVARLRARWPALRCLFVSGYLGDIALGDGFDASKDLVLKPFTSQELLARIADKLVLHARRAPAALAEPVGR